MENNHPTNRTKTFAMASIGVMTAFMCILAPLSIPIGLVPISLITLVIFLALYVLGMKKGALSVIIYLLVGLSGIPVFSGFTSGPSQLLGPTGGYLMGFFFMAAVAGFFIDRFPDQWFLCALGMILGTLICYVFGTAWLAHQAHMTISAALAVAVFPFVPGDLAKIALAAYLGPKLRKRLISANLFEL